MYDHHSKLIEFFETIEYGIDTHKDVVVKTVGEAKSIPFLRQRNINDCIYVRPTADRAPYYLLLDDISPAAAQRHKSKPGRLIIETSADNFQCWIRFDLILSYDQKKALISVAGGDMDAKPTSDRWGRCPGFANRKPKPKKTRTDEKYFYARLTAMTSGVTEAASVEGFLFTPPVGGSGPSKNSLQEVRISSKTNTGRDESKAEFRYACELLRKGCYSHERIIENVARHAFDRDKRHNYNAALIYAARLVELAQISVAGQK